MQPCMPAWLAGEILALFDACDSTRAALLAPEIAAALRVAVNEEATARRQRISDHIAHANPVVFVRDASVEITQTLSEDWEACFRMRAVERGRPELDEVCIRPRQLGAEAFRDSPARHTSAYPAVRGGLTTSVLRKVLVARARIEAQLFFNSLKSDPRMSAHWAELQPQLRGLGIGSFAEQIKIKKFGPERRGKSERYYALVAVTYANAYAKGTRPALAVQKRLRLAKQAAADAIRGARQRGLLSKTDGRKGLAVGIASPLAIALLSPRRAGLPTKTPS
jgi:hypothetical protein